MNEHRQAPQLFSVILAPAALCFVSIDMEGAVLFRPVKLVGFENLPRPVSISGRPIIRTWYTTGFHDHKMWEMAGEHGNKANGSCVCGDNHCQKLGVCDADLSEIPSVVASRYAYLVKVKEQRDTAREKARAKKAAKPVA